MASPATIPPDAAAAAAETLAWEPRDEELYELTGADRKNFLNSYVTQDIKGLPADRVAPAAFLTQKGKLVSTVQVLNLPDRFLLLFPEGYGAKTEAHLATYLMFANAALNRREGEFAPFALRGPKARELLESWLGEALPEGPRILRGRLGEGEVLAFPELDYPEGWRVLTSAAAAVRFRECLANASVSGLLKPADAATLELRRLEAGVPRLGVDMGEDNLVAEVGLDATATSFNKGCYLGQETTARVQSRGHVNRKLTQVKLGQAVSTPLPVEIFQGEKKVGLLTSAAESPRFGGWIGLATVALSAWERPDEIYAAVAGGRISVQKL